MRRNPWAVAVVSGSVIICWQAWRTPMGAVPPTPPEAEPVVREALAAAAQRDRLGRLLLAAFLDEKTDLAARDRYARALGRLRYPPAIPKLIERIDLKGPSRPVDEADVTQGYPCIAALDEFGSAAVPPLVVAYLAEQDEKRQGLLFLAIGKARAKEASLYAQGIMADKGDDKTMHKVRFFLRDLASGDPSVTWPPPWLK